jgi:hypothetical protein
VCVCVCVLKECFSRSGVDERDVRVTGSVGAVWLGVAWASDVSIGRCDTSGARADECEEGREGLRDGERHESGLRGPKRRGPSRVCMDVRHHVWRPRVYMFSYTERAVPERMRCGGWVSEFDGS